MKNLNWALIFRNIACFFELCAVSNVVRVTFPSAEKQLIHMDTKVNAVSIWRGFFRNLFIYIFAVLFAALQCYKPAHAYIYLYILQCYTQNSLLGSIRHIEIVY